MDSPHSERSAEPWPGLGWLEAIATLEGEAHRAVLDDATELASAERAAVRLVDRLRASRGVVLDLPGARAAGEVTVVGIDAVEVAVARGGAWLVPLAHVLGVSGLQEALPAEGEQERRPSLAAMVRAWLGSQVDVIRRDGPLLRGILRAAGADHLDLAGERGPVAVPLCAVIALRRHAP